MRVELFDYALPSDRIAQAPAPERDASRLFVLGGEVAHAHVRDLPDLVAEGTLVVVNDTSVVPARVLGVKEGTGGKAEVFLVRKTEDAGGVQRWTALARGLREGARVLKDDLVITVEGKTGDGLFVVRLEARLGAGARALSDAIRDAGQVPLPPYIKRDPAPEDRARYQTVFARAPGAVAAPTAGLHFTDVLVKRLAARGCAVEACTLHVGLGTFQPVTADDLDDHAMHAEYYEIPRSLAAAIASARERDRPVLAVGTTVVRALESAKDPARPGHVLPGAGETRLLIQPGFRFSVVDRLLTNFHVPRSTLLALVCAFGGTRRVLDAYAAAVREGYRFYSYGDAMLLDPEAA